MENKIVVVGISGASGASRALDFCRSLRDCGYVPMVILTNAAKKVAELEDEILLTSELIKLNIRYWEETDIGASVASGSFQTCGMVVYPTSISTLSKIAYSTNINLLSRSADVHLKERRKLILIVRETPFHLGHLKLMERVCEIGGVIMPLIFSFYHHDADCGISLDGYFKQFDGRVLDQLGINNDLVNRWKG